MTSPRIFTPPTARPALLAASIALLVGLSTDADAQRRAAAPRAPALTACTDLYTFVNKDWLAANTLVAGQGTRSAFGELQATALQQQHELLNAAMQSPQNDVQRLLGDFWASGLDEAAVEADGAKPIAPLIARIDGIRRTRDIAPAIAALHQVGIPVVFNFAPDVDLKALDRHIGYFMQGGMGLPDPAFYTRNDADTQAVLARYRDYVKQILALTGTPKERLEADAKAVIDIETAIARKSQSLADLNNPFRNYVPVPVADAAKRYRNLQLAQFLERLRPALQPVGGVHQFVAVTLLGHRRLRYRTSVQRGHQLGCRSDHFVVLLGAALQLPGERCNGRREMRARARRGGSGAFHGDHLVGGRGHGDRGLSGGDLDIA